MMHKTTARDFRLSQRGRITKKQALDRRKEMIGQVDKYFSGLSVEQQENMINHLLSIGMVDCANFYKKLMKKWVFMSKIIKILRLRILRKYYVPDNKKSSLLKFIGFIPISDLRAIDKNGRIIRFFND